MGCCICLSPSAEHLPPYLNYEEIKVRSSGKCNGGNLSQNSGCKYNKNYNNNRDSFFSTDKSEEGKEDVDEVDCNPPPKLPNIGNSCYINSAIQCIAATPKIKDSLNSVSNRENKTKGLLAKRFKQILLKKKEGVISRRNFQDLKMQVSKHNERFQEHNQEDVAEFLSSFITGVSKLTIYVEI